MISLPIFFDHHSTTPCDARVVEAMVPYFSEHFGNAGSRNHSFGWKAAEAVDQAREQVAQLIGAASKDIIFTSGATESNNLALKGTAGMYRSRSRHFISVTTEHKAVLDPLKRLEQDGVRVTYLEVDPFGRVTPQQIEEALTSDTLLVSVMAANNEVGTLQPIADIGKLCKDRDVLFHCDAAQAVGKIPIDVETMGIDLLSLSAHKIYGPKGVGVLYVRRRHPHVRLAPQIDGGGQERGLRSGTLPVSQIVGLGKACEICRLEGDAEARRIGGLRDRLRQGLGERLDGVTLNGHPEKRLPGNLNLSFAQVEGEALLMALKNIAVSSGSACTSANLEPSYVLKAMGVNDELARSSLRFGLGRFNTPEEVEYVIDEVVRTVEHLRSLNPFFEAGQKDEPKPFLTR